MHVYLITNLIDGKQYIGVEKGNDPKYFGSGKLIGEAIKEFGKENFKKEILIDNKYIDSWKECLKLESACILSLNTLGPGGYNITWWNWPVPVEILREAGKMGGKIGGKRIKELGIAIFVPGMQSKAGKIGGKIGGKRSKELGVGIHDPEKRGIGAKRAKKLGVGIFAPGMRSKGGKIGARRTNELYPGIGAKMNAHTLFEIDGLIQQMTLGAILRI